MNIFLIDDEKLALNQLEKTVIDAIPGEKPHCFQSSREALAYAETCTPDVVFSDVRMPGLSGISLAKALKKINPKVNIIFVTAYSDFKDESIYLHVSGYICKPVSVSDVMNQMDNLLYPQEEEAEVAEFQEESRVFARAFGNFEFFVDGKPIEFPRTKSKELLAYLIDRQGAAISKKDLCAILYEDDYSASVQNYFTKLWSTLRDTLKKYGCEDVLIRHYNSYSVNTSAFSCDSYRYLAGDTQMINQFRGEYMEQYEWAEMYKDKFYN